MLNIIMSEQQPANNTIMYIAIFAFVLCLICCASCFISCIVGYTTVPAMMNKKEAPAPKKEGFMNVNFDELNNLVVKYLPPFIVLLVVFIMLVVLKKFKIFKF
jgi:hypothetical protein